MQPPLLLTLPRLPTPLPVPPHPAALPPTCSYLQGAQGALLGPVLPQVAQTVGVYYASNAVGRLVGTLASGALYSYVGSSIVDGFGACLMVSVAFSAASCAIDFWLHEDAAAAGASGSAA